MHGTSSNALRVWTQLKYRVYSGIARVAPVLCTSLRHGTLLCFHAEIAHIGARRTRDHKGIGSPKDTGRIVPPKAPGNHPFAQKAQRSRTNNRSGGTADTVDAVSACREQNPIPPCQRTRSRKRQLLAASTLTRSRPQ